MHRSAERSLPTQSPRPESPPGRPRKPPTGTPPHTSAGGAGGWLFTALQRVLPQHPLSRVVHGLSRLRAGPLTRLGIRAYAHGFGVDLRDAAMSDLADYPTFNAFFTRALRADARPLDPRGNTLLCPVDGTVSQLGRLSGGRLVQAKGHDFDATELLGGDAALAAPFTDGSFATLYLSPRDYHRIHMPLTGTLTTALHVPGRLFSVNATTAARVPRLYARNERVACLFETAAGPLAVVLVGAIFVGSIETIWHGEITPPRGRRVRPLPSPSSVPVPVLERGAELGRFNLGSTVILLLPADAAAWRRDLKPGRAVRMGEALGRLEARR